MSITTPKILAVYSSATVFPLIINGVVLVQSMFLVKCTNIVFLPLNVALFHFSQFIALLMIALMPSRFTTANSPIT